MESPLESPWPAILLGIVLEGVLSLALWITRRGWLVWGMAGAAVLTGALVLLEWWIVTDREQIRDLIRGAARAAEANDVAALESLIAEDAAALRHDVRRLLALVTIRRVHITSDIAAAVDTTTQPPTALAQVSVVVTSNLVTYPTTLQLRLRKEDDGTWRLIDYRERGGLPVGRKRPRPPQQP
jgi:hypothetical protein